MSARLRALVGVMTVSLLTGAGAVAFAEGGVVWAGLAWAAAAFRAGVLVRELRAARRISQDAPGTGTGPR